MIFRPVTSCTELEDFFLLHAKIFFRQAEMISRISLIICALVHTPHSNAGNGVFKNTHVDKDNEVAIETRRRPGGGKEIGRVSTNTQNSRSSGNGYRTESHDHYAQNGNQIINTPYQTGSHRSDRNLVGYSMNSAPNRDEPRISKYDRRFAVDDLDEVVSRGSFACSKGQVFVHYLLGEGSYGKVFSGILNKSDGTQRRIAIKFQKPIKKRFQFPLGLPSHYAEIEHEYAMMKLMKGVKGFVSADAANFAGKWKYFVTDLLGPDIHAYCKAFNFRLKVDVAIRLTRQMLMRIRTVHEKGYVAQDVHLGNFVLDQQGRVHMIDLAFAFPYRQIDGTHIPDTPSHFPFRRDRRKVDLATRREEEGLETSRADDIERLLYMLLEMLGGNLPWARENDDMEAKRIKYVLTSDPRRLCKIRNVPWLSQLFVKVFKLKFDQEPPYSWIDGYLKDIPNFKEIASFER